MFLFCCRLDPVLLYQVAFQTNGGAHFKLQIFACGDQCEFFRRRRALIAALLYRRFRTPEGEEDAARRRASPSLCRQEIFNRRHMRSQCRVHRHGATFLTVSRSLSDISAGFCRSTYCDGGETKGPSSRDAEKREIFPRPGAHFSPTGGSRREAPIADIAWRIASHPERKRG